MRIGLLPGDLAPGIGDLLADHRVEDAVLVVGIAIGKATLDAGMAAVGLAILPRHHAHQLLAAHLRLERAADAAIGTGGDDGMFRLADLDDRFLCERRRRASLHAGAAGDAFRRHEVFRHAGGNTAVETAAADRQRKGALHFLAGPHAARADDALGRIIGEVWIGLVLRQPLGIDFAIVAGRDVVLALIPVAHVAQADGAGHVLQLAIAIGRAGQTVERVVGDVKLHHPPAHVLQPRRLGGDFDTRRHRRRARGRHAGASLDLDETEPAGAEGIHHVGGAELRHLDASVHRRAHDRGSLRYRDFAPVDRQRHQFFGLGSGSAVVDFMYERHGLPPHSAASTRGAG
ncbi:hypothetical protein D9M68_187140 [compost metagenome]